MSQLEAVSTDYPWINADIVVATQNEGKIVSFNREFAEDYQLYFLKVNIPENHDNVEDNAGTKALVGAALTAKPCLGDDSGCYVPERSDILGLKTKRWLKDNGIEALLEMIPDEGWKAHWKMTLAYTSADLEVPVLFTSYIPGRLINELRGPEREGQKSVLWQNFIIEGQTQTIAEMDPEVHKREAVSDRWAKMKDYLK